MKNIILLLVIFNNIKFFAQEKFYINIDNKEIISINKNDLDKITYSNKLELNNDSILFNLKNGNVLKYKIESVKEIVLTPPKTNNLQTHNILEPEIKCFPNPTKDIINIELNQISGPVEIEIINSSGISIKKIFYSNFNKKIDIEMSNFSDGLYTIRIIANQFTIIKQIIKI